ncbi:MAG: nucleoside 2-deoxyribosyltransferase, partial [Blastocatellia bacterium]
RHDQDVYQVIVSMLREYGLVRTEHVADPGITADGEGQHPTDIHDRDIEWLRDADVIVAEVSSPSLGVGYEIGRAVAWNKKVVALFRSDGHRKLSPMIRGNSGVIVRNYESPGDLRGILTELFDTSI